MVKRGIKIKILPTAKTDLREIVDFIARGSRKYALLEKRLIISAIDRLADFPNLGNPFEYRTINARQFVFRNYLIIYHYKTENLLEILSIHHHARLIGNNPAFKDDE